MVITVMMLVLLFLFQFSSIMREVGNEYGTNHYDVQTRSPYTASESVTKPGWTPQGVSEEVGSERLQGQEYAVFCGDLDNTAIGHSAREWAVYAKIPIIEVTSLPVFAEQDPLPYVILIDSFAVDFDTDIETLEQYTQLGIHLLFCNIPSYDEIVTNRSLRELFGIRTCLSESITLVGHRLFGGFLLGGEVYYETQDPEEWEERQDLDVEVPWYRMGSGVETYMVGMVEESLLRRAANGATDTTVTNGYLPAILWMHSIKDSRVFCVNADFLETAAGPGIIKAMITQTKSYDLYPVVNAQNTVIVNFPWLANEENTILRQIYGRSQSEVLRDIIWPGMMAIAENNGVIPTCLLMTQFHYAEHITPNGEDFISYMKLLGEEQAETGRSLSRESAYKAADKIIRDEAFLEEWLPDYAFLSFAPGNMTEQDWQEIQRWGLLADVRTLVLPPGGTQKIIAYDSETITAQSSI
ncbi:MAG: DUF2194 domain-containing protein, partial [Lachnospiraceae bacterium]|nr:DUF2194 domain-containing protein [Lachnospiraceae bacterium]